VQGDGGGQGPHIGHAAQVAADDVLEGHIEAVADTADFKDRADVAMAELHDNAGLFREAGQQLGIVGAVIAQHL
jgi:hypothetical protein